MKLVIKQYLASLKERDELDAILPDLLSQMGLNVYSRPSRGTRQDGVDVAAVGCIDGGGEKVYLFSIKSGDLTRQSWNAEGVQSLRPSLDSIRDVYVSSRLPAEHKNKEIVVCLCFGGDIQEQVRSDVTGYIEQNKRSGFSFEEWNGDKLASLILTHFLREDVMPKEVRTYLRKSLAMLDEPEVSYKHFLKLIEYFSSVKEGKEGDHALTLRQINICLWILFSWARDAGNVEAAYLSAEVAMLHSWKLVKSYTQKSTKTAQSVKTTFDATIRLYLQITDEYLTKILPHCNKRHGLSAAVEPSADLDVNLKLFDLIGRMAVAGLWYCWILSITDQDDVLRERRLSVMKDVSSAIKSLIINNPALFLPVKDEQVIDISIVALLWFVDGNGANDLRGWLSEMMDRAHFAFLTKANYPCVLTSYVELLDHPQADENYFQEVTTGSVLFPMIALWASVLNDGSLYNKVQTLREKYLKHSNFQVWYPDDASEEYFYDDKDSHGAVLSHVCIERPIGEFKNQLFCECERSTDLQRLSAVESGFWPLIIMACRHYRMPVPVHFWNESLKESKDSVKGSDK